MSPSFPQPHNPLIPQSPILIISRPPRSYFPAHPPFPYEWPKDAMVSGTLPLVWCQTLSSYDWCQAPFPALPLVWCQALCNS